MLIQFTIPGNPKALKRHRTFRRGKFTGQYDPSKDDKADFLTLAMAHRPEVPFDEPLSLKIAFYFQRPKSHYGTGKNSGVLKQSAPHYHTVKPDFDNTVKFICDALNGVFWRDDSIICHSEVCKLYSDHPCTTISVCTIY